MSHIAAHGADIEMFEGLTDADLADLDDRFAMATFRKGELIYSPFDRGDAMFLIESGRVRLFRSASDGRQVTLAMLDPGASFGQIAVLDDPTHDAYAECMSDSVVRVLRVTDLERAIAEHPRVALNLMRSLSDRLRTAEDQIESLAFRPVPSRLNCRPSFRNTVTRGPNNVRRTVGISVTRCIRSSTSGGSLSPGPGIAWRSIGKPRVAAP